MCPWREMRAAGGTMSWETFSRIRQYLHLADGVDFTGGGEPTNNPRLIDMLHSAKNAGCQTGFSTNGMRLSPSMSAALLNAGLDWISFSVDAATAQVYGRIRQGASFEMVTGNIAALRDLKAARGTPYPRMMMVFVMMGGSQAAVENYHQLPQYLELAHSLGVEQVIAKNLDVILTDKDDERRLFSHDGPPRQDVLDVISEAEGRAKSLGIGLRLYALQPQERAVCEHNPLQSLYFSWDGYISPCITLAYAGQRVFNGEQISVPCQQFGNIHQESVDEIWDKPGYREFREMYKHRSRADQEGMIDALLGRGAAEALKMPPPPEGCRTCYYLYGI